MVNAHSYGREYRYAYNMTAEPGMFLFDGVVKHDLHTGCDQRYVFGDGVYGSETPFAPRPGATAEDDGYLVTFTTDMVRDLSECLIFDAASLTDGPIAKVRLPERISSGTHSCWTSAVAAARQLGRLSRQRIRTSIDGYGASGRACSCRGLLGAGLWTLGAGSRRDQTQGMTTQSRTRHDMRGWPESRVGRRAITLAGLSVTGIVLLVLGFALDVVEPADSYTDSWAQLVWGVGIWVCAVAAFVAGLVAIVRHHERSWMVVLATALGLLPVVLLLSEIALGKF